MKMIEINDSRMMEMSDAFMSDPFLALDSDLDDVSEVIRSNLVGETFDSLPIHEPDPHFSGSEAIMPSSDRSIASSGTTSAVEIRPLPGVSPHEMYDKEERNKQIGQIVSLLQDDAPMLTSHVDGPTSSAVSAAAQQLSHDALDTAVRLRAFEARHQMAGAQPLNGNVLETLAATQQQYFIDAHSSEVNFATLRADSVARSPQFADQQFGYLTPSPDAFTRHCAPSTTLFDGRGVYDTPLMESDEVFLGDGMHNSRRSGLSDEILHISTLHDDINVIPYCTHETGGATSSYAHSNPTSMPSPSLSDFFPAGDIFPPQPAPPSEAQFYLDDAGSTPPPPYASGLPYAGGHFEPEPRFQYPHPTHMTATYEDGTANTEMNTDGGDGTGGNSKNDLIRILLEMSHTELETLRLSRNNSAVDIAGSVLESRGVGGSHAKLQRQAQKASTASLPPLDPPPRATVVASKPNITVPKRKTPLKNPSTISVPDEFTLLVGGQRNVKGHSTNSPDEALPFTFHSISPTYYDAPSFVAKAEESDEDESDAEQSASMTARGTSNGSATSPTKRGPKTERRTAHNLIEKKYRCSINDRINHLKTMLASEETKLSKSATLRKAIDHINVLRAQNVDLTHENRRLRALLDAAGVVVPSRDTMFSHSPPTAGTPFYGPRGSSSSADSSPPTSASPTAVEATPITGLNDLLQPVADVSAAGGRKRPMLSAPSSQKVTLCIFMFVIVTFNPLSFFISSDGDSTQPSPHIYAHHRTLRSDGVSPFDYINNGETYGIHGNATFWLKESIVKRCFVWALNALLVIFVLMRLFIYTEPVADGQSAAWREFLAAKERARRAVISRNYRETQRQLCDALALIGREIPCAGSVEELFSVAWQIVRHLLNSVWVGRWLARRRRSATQPSAAVCRSHAATALVYHQIQQLHLIGVNGVELSELGALNLALAAVNLAESAGIFRHGITHRTRADIYINAALRAKFTCCYFGALFYSYFMRRAKRHVRKAQMVDGADVRSMQWIFHPLGRKFLKSHADVVTDVFRSALRPLNFPFSDAQISPKPTECLTNAFKMHLLALLAQHLSALNISSRGTLTDFVEISHFLLEICTSIPTLISARQDDASMLDWWGGENGVSDVPGNGDELCTWWTHLITGGLYWRHGDYPHAQTHYAIVRRCPKRLLNNDLALAAGLAFCARKMCFDDRTKRNFTEMVWIHAQRSFRHLEKDNFSIFVHRNIDTVATIRKCCRAITCEWIMTSLIDAWNNQVHVNQPCWQNWTPHLVHKLYSATYRHFESCEEFADKKKLMAFKVMEKGVNWSKTSSDDECNTTQ